MKINPVSIQSYQQIAGRDAAEKNKQAAKAEQSLRIEPQKNSESSGLAVELSGADYAGYLSTEEHQALDMLFGKFRNADRFGAGYQSGASKSNAPIGRVIDVKV